MKNAILYCLVCGLCFVLLHSCKHKEQVSKTVTKESVKNQKSTSTHHNSQKAQEVKKEWSETLGVSKKYVRDNKLYTFIEDWYGTPYKYSGCTKSGIDCSCFTGMLYKKVYGVTVGRNTSLIYKEADHIKTSHLREGDLVFFNAGTKDVSHVGVYLKDNKFVHASTSKGVMINDLNETYYKKYYYGAGRVKLHL